MWQRQGNKITQRSRDPKKVEVEGDTWDKEDKRMWSRKRKRNRGKADTKRDTA